MGCILPKKESYTCALCESQNKSYSIVEQIDVVNTYPYYTLNDIYYPSQKRYIKYTTCTNGHLICCEYN